MVPAPMIAAADRDCWSVFRDSGNLRYGTFGKEGVNEARA
jgi:hypothetical protein